MTSTQRKAILSYPGVMQHAQQIARALHEADELDAFITGFRFRENGLFGNALRLLPGRYHADLLRQLRRRAITEVPAALVHSHPFWEVMRTVAAKSGASAIAVDKLWDVMAHSFDETVASRYVPHAKVVHAFEYTALASFKRAGELGAARVLHLPSLDSKSYESIRQRELAEWPELAGEHDAYFNKKFGQRYERRLQEIALADVIIANSSLTRRSHIEAGADPDKILVVPLGAPPPVDRARDLSYKGNRPLTVIWASSFQLGKGAHYFLEAWRRFAPGNRARVVVYGGTYIPQRMRASIPEGIEFRGSVSQPELFLAFEQADVLVFPTLSDGFGMVVTEAFSRGLPVITTNRAGAADLVEQGKNGLLVPDADAGALRDALQWCLDNPDALANMRHAALETAKQHQWADYRASLREAVNDGLKHNGAS